MSLCDKTYSGLGTTKTDAKTNAAANAVEDLRASGRFAARERKLNSERRGLITDKQASILQNRDCELLGELILSVFCVLVLLQFYCTCSIICFRQPEKVQLS